MIIKSIEVEIKIGEKIGINQLIETTIQQWGEPLRWAITTIDPVSNIAQIEAVVIVDSRSSIG